MALFGGGRGLGSGGAIWGACGATWVAPHPPIFVAFASLAHSNAVALFGGHFSKLHSLLSRTHLLTWLTGVLLAPGLFTPALLTAP